MSGLRFKIPTYLKVRCLCIGLLVFIILDNTNFPWYEKLLFGIAVGGLMGSL